MSGQVAAGAIGGGFLADEGRAVLAARSPYQRRGTATPKAFGVNSADVAARRNRRQAERLPYNSEGIGTVATGTLALPGRAPGAADAGYPDIECRGRRRGRFGKTRVEAFVKQKGGEAWERTGTS
jgi:hypothetical protein